MSGAGSAPPSVAGDAVPAAGASGGQHPLWQTMMSSGGSGRGGGNKRGRAPSPREPPPLPAPSRFAPISMLELELRARNELDGASSAASDDERSRRREKEPHVADYGADESEGGDDVDERPRARRRRSADEDEDQVAGAAFGINRTTALSVVSDTDDSASVTSETMRDLHRLAFPISGVSCVGCAMPTKVVAVDDFVRTTCDKMTEHALYKMAALVYCQKVVEPARAEGVAAPQWGWKDIRAHYTLHRIDPRMQRLQNVRCLQLMRSTLELQLLKEDEEGQRSLDHGNTEKVLKVTQQLSREISLIDEQAPAKAKK